MSGGSVRVLYFAWLRERIGVNEETISLPDGVADVAGLVEWLRARGGGYERAFAAGGVVRCAVNQTVARSDSRVSPGDEVAFFPPVTGG